MRTILVVLAALLLAGCAASPAPHVPAPPGPDGRDASDGLGLRNAGSASLATASGLTPVANASAPGGYALRVHEDRAYVATFSPLEGVSVFDVSDPLAPARLGGIPGQLARSVDVLDWGARVGVAISTGDDLQVWELTDPQDPVLLASMGFPSHNVVVHPGANLVYNARNIQDGVGGAMEIVNASDPDHVTLERVWRFEPFAADGSVVHNQGCHDLTVWPDQQRAYCAAYEQTLVMDVADPANPVILSAITNPLVTDHHTAFPILNHTVLVVSDEWAANLAWGCLGHGLAQVPELPVGALWFYDLTTPTPEVLSYVAGPRLPPEPWFVEHGVNAMCTSHNGQELGEGTGLIAYGWFRAGIVLIDASDPTAPILLDVVDYGGAVGDARWHRGHVLAADDRVGLTVLRVD